MNTELEVIMIELNDYLGMIYPLAQKCTDISDNLIHENLGWDNQKDLRILFFIFMRERIQNCMFAEILSKNLIDPNWYASNGMEGSLTGDKEYDDLFMRGRMFHFGVWIKSSFFMGSFTEAETALRIIAQNYDGGSCYHHSITTLVNNLIDRLGLNHHLKGLWKIFAYTRNTTHSGGFHTHDSGNQSMVYKGQQFDFIKDEPVNFLTPKNLMFILTEIVEFMNEVISHPSIIEIAELRHPYSRVEFVQ